MTVQQQETIRGLIFLTIIASGFSLLIDWKVVVAAICFVAVIST